MKRSICFICFTLISIISLKAQTLRNTIALNGIWRFISDSTNAGQAKQNVMKALEDYFGLAWYEKICTVPAQYRNTQLRLKFEAIYHDAVIYVNGVQLATHTNAGYTTFYVDITNVKTRRNIFCSLLHRHQINCLL